MAVDQLRVLVTGANGFVGQALVDKMLANSCSVTALVREASKKLPVEVKQVSVGDFAEWEVIRPDNIEDACIEEPQLAPDFCVDGSSVLEGCEPSIKANSKIPNSKIAPNDFRSNAPAYKSSITAPSCEQSSKVDKLTDTLQQVDVIVHAAACVQVNETLSFDRFSLFRRINTDVTLAMARQAASAGVRRFIFLSTVKVNGESTTGRRPFEEQDDCCPTEPYGLSKWEAEQGLMDIAKVTGMEIVIIRPPLVYGPNVKGNFASMMKWAGRGIPLPLGLIENQRSFIALDNLVSFVIHCLKHPEAANECFLISDSEDVSTTELLRKMAVVQQKKVRLIPIPVAWMRFIAKLLGKQDVAVRLFDSLQLDSSKARKLLGWQPVISMDEQLKKIVD